MLSVIFLFSKDFSWVNKEITFKFRVIKKKISPLFLISIKCRDIAGNFRFVLIAGDHVIIKIPLYLSGLLYFSGLIVAGLARRVEKIEELAASLQDASGKLHPIECDVSQEDSVVAAFTWIRENLGTVNILINNAGITKESSLTGKPYTKPDNITPSF